MGLQEYWNKLAASGHPHWLGAIAYYESKWNEGEIHPNSKAAGVFQLAPSVLNHYAKTHHGARPDPHSAASVDVMTWYWKWLSRRWMRPEWRVFAYVVGPGRLKSGLKVHPMKPGESPITWRARAFASGRAKELDPMLLSDAKHRYVAKVAILAAKKTRPVVDDELWIKRPSQAYGNVRFWRRATESKPGVWKTDPEPVDYIQAARIRAKLSMQPKSLTHGWAKELQRDISRRKVEMTKELVHHTKKIVQQVEMAITAPIDAAVWYVGIAVAGLALIGYLTRK